jgi:hypothetical protein
MRKTAFIFHLLSFIFLSLTACAAWDVPTATDSTTAATAAELAAVQATVNQNETDAADDLSAHTSRGDDPHGVTAAQVGLGSVDNTSDADKPVSAAQQAALDLKQAAATAATDAELSAGLATKANLNGDNIPEYPLSITVSEATDALLNQTYTLVNNTPQWRGDTSAFLIVKSADRFMFTTRDWITVNTYPETDAPPKNASAWTGGDGTGPTLTYTLPTEDFVDAIGAAHAVDLAATNADILDKVGIPPYPCFSVLLPSGMYDIEIKASTNNFMYPMIKATDLTVLTLYDDPMNRVNGCPWYGNAPVLADTTYALINNGAGFWWWSTDGGVSSAFSVANGGYVPPTWLFNARLDPSTQYTHQQYDYWCGGTSTGNDASAITYYTVAADSGFSMKTHRFYSRRNTPSGTVEPSAEMYANSTGTPTSVITYPSIDGKPWMTADNPDLKWSIAYVSGRSGVQETLSGIAVWRAMEPIWTWHQ